MSDPLNVLIVEDRPADAKLMAIELAEAGFDPRWERVETEEDYVARLGPAVDVVLADYCLPQFDGLRALQILQERRLDIPFVFVSGSMGEDVAVQAMRQGAADYLIKDRLTRLGPAVRRALEQKVLREKNRQAGETHRQEAAKTRAVFDALPAHLALLDPDGTIVLVNEAWRRFAAANVLQSANYGVGTNYVEVCLNSHGDCSEEARRAAEGICAVLAGTLPSFSLEYPCHSPNEQRWFRMMVSPIVPGQAGGAVVMHINITERRLAEEKLRASEERYRTLLERIPEPLFVYDRETLAYLAVNDAAVTNYGYSRDEFLRMKITDVRPPEDVPALLEMLANSTLGYEHRGVWRHRKKDGKLIEAEITAHSLELSGRPACIALAKDITEKRSLEQQFRQAQKMEAVGRLAGGVAHDFNNLLTVINGFSEIVAGTLPPNHPARDLVGQIREAGERAAGLTRQLLAFSRKTVQEPKVLDLNAQVRDMDKLLRRLIGEDIDVATRLAPNLGRVKADPSQLEQAIINLCVNARDAMPQGGKITIETQDVELDDAYAREHPDVQPGNYVLLAVSDTGHGMDADTQARIFEPFFTTKEQGKGTGLGLAMVYGFVKQSGGHVAVYSAPSKGATFKLYLPLAVGAVTARKSQPSLNQWPRGTETVLLVEDEDGVRALTCHLLRTCGYAVLEAGHGREAVRVAGGHAGPLHLLITDVVMPGGMGGRQVAEAVRGLHPQSRVLFVSGYTDDAMVRHGVLEAEVPFLQKPYNPAALAQKVREVLDATI